MGYQLKMVCVCGTLDYSVDWWALGVLLYELLAGTSPFDTDSLEHSNNDRLYKCK